MTILAFMAGVATALSLSWLALLLVLWIDRDRTKPEPRELGPDGYTRRPF